MALIVRCAPSVGSGMAGDLGRAARLVIAQLGMPYPCAIATKRRSASVEIASTGKEFSGYFSGIINSSGINTK
jgi:hypothetical protein